ncbi:MAG: oligosaccharide flippase family protein [Alistipes sp.]|nr:oligosaccharide flippase family protein [Alistipes sp.]
MGNKRFDNMGRVKRDSLMIMILSYVGIVVGYVNKILLFPNFLSEEQVGLATILVSLATMYAQFSALGINYTVVRFFPFFRTPDGRHNGFFFWTTLGVSGGFVLFTVLFLLFRAPIMDYYAREAPLLTRYYLWLIPLGLAMLFFNFFTAWLQALYRTVASSFVNEVLLRLLITAEITLFAFGVLDFEQFVIGYVLIYCVPTLVLLLYAAAIGAVRLQPVCSMRVRRLLSVAVIYGLWQYLGGTSMYIVPVIDQAMLAGMKGLAEGGIYVTMVYMVGAILVPSRSMIKVATPLVANLWRERNMEALQGLSRRVSLINLIVGCYLFLLIWVNLDNIFSLIPSSYATGRTIFLMLGIARLMDLYSGLNGTILVTSKRYRYDFIFSLLLVGLTICTNRWLIPRWGMNGAALATMGTVVAYNVIRVISVWHFFRINPFRWRDAIVPGLMGATLGVAALLPPIGNFLTDVPIRTLCVTGLYGGAVYGLKLSEDLNRTLDQLGRKTQEGLQRLYARWTHRG